MFPRIEVIGKIDSKEDIGPGQPEGRLMLSVAFRSGALGSFRAICPAAEMRALAIGDDVLIVGELDELGAIRLLHGGMIRKLAPTPAPLRQDAAPPVAVDATPAQPIIVPPSPAPKPPVAAAAAATPSAARPAANMGNAPKSPFGWKGSFGSPFAKPFGGAKPTAATGTTNPVSAPASAPQASATTPPLLPEHNIQPMKPQGFVTAKTAVRNGTPTPVGAQKIPPTTEAQARPTARRSELAELLQDEIPW